MTRTAVGGSGAGLFRFFLSIPDGATVLVNDAYLGGTALCIAPLAEHVVCYCGSVERARQVKNTIREAGNRNIDVIVGDVTRLPVRPGSLDNICYHGLTLEDGQPSEQSLREMHVEIDMALKVGGQGYLSFDGSQASHPEKSIRRVLRNMRHDGLRIISVIDHYPALAKSHFVRRIGVGNAWRILRNVRSLLKVCFVRNNLGVILSRNAAPRGEDGLLLEGIRREIAGKGMAGLRLPELIRVGSGGSVVADYGILILRMPQTNVGEKRCVHNYETLSRLENIDLPVKVPKPATAGCYREQFYYAETKIRGVSMDLKVPSARISQRVYEKAEAILTSDAVKLGTMERDTFAFLVQQEIESLTPFVMRDDRDVLAKITLKMKDVFLEDHLPLVVHHGDFKFSNLLCNAQGELNGVIDWDLARIPGLPLYDLLTLRYYRQVASVSKFLEYLSRTVMGLEVHEDILRYASKMKIARRCIELVGLMSIVKCMNDHYYDIQLKQTQGWYVEILRKNLMTSCLHVLR